MKDVDVRIEKLEVQFDVVGDDEREFLRLLSKHLPAAFAANEKQKQRRRTLEAERDLGDRHGRGGGQ